jgi:hypothetical protein
MKTKVTIPAQAPEHRRPGFYYHRKHDPSKGVFHHAYLILGAGMHTEDEIEPEDQFMQVYLPLHEEALVYRLGSLFDLRPLGMAMEDVEVEGVMVPRFTAVEDPDLVQAFTKRLRELYPEMAKYFAD